MKGESSSQKDNVKQLVHTLIAFSLAVAKSFVQNSLRAGQRLHVCLCVVLQREVRRWPVHSSHWELIQVTWVKNYSLILAQNFSANC